MSSSTSTAPPESSPSRPIALTLGDPCGIGPETLVRAFAQGEANGCVIYGDAAWLARTARTLRFSPDSSRPAIVELDELAEIYVRRGLDPALARQVAEQLTAHDDLGTHLRDELGIHDLQRARPVQAGLASALAFTSGALPPVLLAWLWPGAGLAVAIVVSTLILLALLGYLAERVAGGRGLRGALRVLSWGALAMGATALIGHLFGVSLA